MDTTLTIITIWFGVMLIAMIAGLSSDFRRFFSRCFDNWRYKRRQIKEIFKYNSTHIKKYDWIKFYSLAVIILFAVIIISGVLSHFGAVNKAKNVCYARLGNKDCNVKTNEYEYFIPGTKASIFDFPYKLGIAYKCRCDDDTKTIIMNMATKVKVETVKEESNFVRGLRELYGISNST